MVNRNLKVLQKCLVNGCDNTNIVAKGFCCKHYKQQYRYGHVLKRTIYDRNEFVFKDDMCIIQCFDKTGNVTAESIIDLEDFDKIKDKKCSYLKIGYLYCCTEKILLHRLLIQDKLNSKDNTVDHINRDKLDNRKSNLRVLTRQQNLLNKGLQSNNSSGVRGVKIKELKNGEQVYESRIKLNGKEKYLGRNRTIEEAKISRKQAEQEMFGEGLIYEE